MSIAITIVATLLGLPVHAAVDQDPTLPLRPTTFPVNDGITDGAIENFRELYLDPATSIATAFSKKKQANEDTLTDLPIDNRSTVWTEVEVNGVRVGLLDPLTVAVIHGVPPGDYTVSFTHRHGYKETRTISTRLVEGTIIPGGKSATISLETGLVNRWSDDPSKGYGDAEPKGPSRGLGTPGNQAPEASQDDIQNQLNDSSTGKPAGPAGTPSK